MVDRSPDRNEILDGVHRNWSSLITKLQSFPESELTIPNVIGIWSLKDLIGHLETWDRVAIRKIGYAEQGQTDPWWLIENQPFATIDEFNEADADANRHKPIAQLWAELHATHAELIDRMESANAIREDLIREDTYEHYEGHLNDIVTWQSERDQQSDGASND